MRASLLFLCLWWSAAALASNECQAPTAQCLRGSGNDVIKVFDAGTPQAADTGACCAACKAFGPVCVASMLVSRNGKPAECWLERVQDFKSPVAGEECNATLVGPPPPVPPPSRFNRTRFSGVWLQHGDWTDPAMFTASFLVGSDLPIYWSDIEPADGVFNWTSTDSAFEAAAAAGLYIETALSLGSGDGGSLDKLSGVPSWIYSRAGGSVPRVAVASSQGKGMLYFPFYLDPNYRPLFLRAVEAFAAHIATYPPSLRKFIVASQAMFGSTGDDTPWHGTPVLLKYNISDAQWQAFTGYNTTSGLATALCKVYAAIDLPVLWNPGDDCTGCINTMAAACPGSFFKSGMESHGISINYEGACRLREPLCRIPR